MENLLSGLAILGITGLAGIAYKHPDSFKRYSGGALWGFAAIIIMAATWQAAILLIFYKIEPLLDTNCKSKAIEAISPFVIPMEYILVAVLANMFLLLLANLKWLGFYNPKDSN